MDEPSHVLCSESNRILGDDRLTCRSVRRDKDRFSDFDVINRFFLERIELEGVL